MGWIAMGLLAVSGVEEIEVIDGVAYPPVRASDLANFRHAISVMDSNFDNDLSLWSRYFYWLKESEWRYFDRLDEYSRELSFAEKSFDSWIALRYSHHRYPDGTVFMGEYHYQSLRKLRRILGPDRYYSGWMPPASPECRCVKPIYR